MALEKNIKKKVSYELMDKNDVFIHNGLEIYIEKELTLNRCYLKITSIMGNKENMTINVSIYSNVSKENLIDVKKYDFIPNVSDTSDNFIKQGYEYLKTLSEYEGAIDILEEGQIL